MGILCGKAECMWRFEEVVKAASGGGAAQTELNIQLKLDTWDFSADKVY